MCLFALGFICFVDRISISMVKLDHHGASAFLELFETDLDATLKSFRLLTTQLL